MDWKLILDILRIKHETIIDFGKEIVEIALNGINQNHASEFQNVIFSAFETWKKMVLGDNYRSHLFAFLPSTIFILIVLIIGAYSWQMIEPHLSVL